MTIIKRKPKEYIVSYIAGSIEGIKEGTGHTIWQQEDGQKFNAVAWQNDTVSFWNKRWGVSDSVVTITNIYKNE